MEKNKYDKYRAYLSQRLIEAREKAGYTQKQLEDMGIITQSKLSKMEGGKRKVDAVYLMELAQLYEQPMDFFIYKPTRRKK